MLSAFGPSGCLGVAWALSVHDKSDSGNASEVSGMDTRSPEMVGQVPEMLGCVPEMLRRFLGGGGMFPEIV